MTLYYQCVAGVGTLPAITGESVLCLSAPSSLVELAPAPHHVEAPLPVCRVDVAQPSTTVEAFGPQSLVTFECIGEAVEVTPMPALIHVAEAPSGLVLEQPAGILHFTEPGGTIVLGPDSSFIECPT